MYKIDGITARFLAGCKDLEIESIVEDENKEELARKFEIFRSKLPDGYVDKASLFIDVYGSDFEGDDYFSLDKYLKEHFGFGFIEYFNSTLGIDMGPVNPGGHIEIYWDVATAKVSLDEAIEISERAFKVLAESGIESDFDIPESDDINRRIEYIIQHINLSNESPVNNQV